MSKSNDREVQDTLDLLPTDMELADLSQKLQATVVSRAELMNRISKLQLKDLSLESKMIYALGMIALGFDERRALDRMGISNAEYYIWKQHPEHETMLRQNVARGEMILEEKVLVEADKNPEMAFKLLQEKTRKRERKEDKQERKEENLMDMLKTNAKERGLVIDGEIVDDVLK